jgi:hypothetical protein
MRAIAVPDAENQAGAQALTWIETLAARYCHTALACRRRRQMARQMSYENPRPTG